MKFRLYADNIQFYFSISDIESTVDKLNIALQSVKEWMDLSQLKLNSDKTDFILIGNKGRINNIDFNVNDNLVSIDDKVCDLGVILDCSLSLNAQINNVVRIDGYYLKNITFVRK